MDVQLEIQTLRETVCILKAQQESAPYGVLLVNTNWQMVSWNLRFVTMWGVKQEILARRDDKASLQSILDQLKKPEAFLQRVERLMEHPEEVSSDELELKDGRFFHRYSQPIMDGDCTHCGRVWYFTDITEKKKNELELSRYQQKLENVVSDRTHQIKQANADLQRGREELLAHQNELETMNAALRTLMGSLEREKNRQEKKVALNIREVAFPLIMDLEKKVSGDQGAALLGSLRQCLLDISSSMSSNLSTLPCKLTAAETKVANLICNGSSTKEISSILGCSVRTVESHRRALRKKTSLTHSKENLRSYLLRLC